MAEQGRQGHVTSTRLKTGLLKVWFLDESGFRLSGIWMVTVLNFLFKLLFFG